MMVARNPRGLMGPAALVVVPVPERGRADGLKAAKILESLALLGRGVPDSDAKRAELKGLMADLKGVDLKIEFLLDSHAGKYVSGHYRENDTDQSEQRRMNLVLTFAIYTVDSLRLMHNRALELDDSGVSSLFESALRESSALLHGGFFEMGLTEAVQRFQRAHPLLVSSLRACGLDERVHTVPGTFEVHRHETLRRLKGAIEAAEAEEADGPGKAVGYK